MLLLPLVLLFQPFQAHSTNRPCPEVLAIDITDGTKHGSVITHHGVNYASNDRYTQDNITYGCVCNVKKPCTRKCCGPGEVMDAETAECTPKDLENNFSYPIHDGTKEVKSASRHHFVHGMECDYEKIMLEPEMNAADRYYIQEDGSIFLPDFRSARRRGQEHFCVDAFHDNGSLSTFVLLCLLPEDMQSDENNNIYGMIVSIPFLLATFIVYAVLPDRNLHMKALMFYVINLTLSYILFAVTFFVKFDSEDISCVYVGYCTLLFLVASFFWMNVICIDIWFAFSSLRGFSGSRKVSERKRFFMYCVYAWGMSILHVLIVHVVETKTDSISVYKPGIGDGQCFLKRTYPELLYLYGPIAVLITVNIVLFAITSLKIRSIRRDTSMLKRQDSRRHVHENDRQTFNLYLKLLLAMGVNWAAEILAWAVDWIWDPPKEIWYLTDFCNALYGVFIFFMFVFKRSIWKLLKQRYYSFRGKSDPSYFVTMTSMRNTSYSTANSSVTEGLNGLNSRPSFSNSD